MVQRLILVIFYWEKNYMKLFQFITFRMKLQEAQNHCVSGSTKLSTWYYVVMDCLIKFVIRSNIL